MKIRALIFAARLADMLLHPIAFLRGRRRLTLAELRERGLLDKRP